VLQTLSKPYIRTSAKATIQHLKKFLAKKMQLDRPDDVSFLSPPPSPRLPVALADPRQTARLP
jgi:hypothetical protein